MYAQYNVTEQLVDGQYDTTPNVGDFQLFRYEGGVTKITSRLTTHTFTGSETFTIRESRKNQSGLSSAIQVTMSGTTSATFVADINGKVNSNAAETSTTELKYVKASKLATGEIVIEHTLGGDLRFNDGATAANPLATGGTPLADAGFSTSTAHSYGGYTANSSTLVDNLYDAPVGDTQDSTTATEVIASNWKRLSYTASTSSPSNEPVDGTLWYNTSLEADIMALDGTTGTWKGYKTVYSTTDINGPQFSATAPTKQSDGNSLVTNDLWIDTSDLENFPKLYKYNTAASISSTNTANQVAVTTIGAAWVLVDNTDQTTEDGVVFALSLIHI